MLGFSYWHHFNGDYEGALVLGEMIIEFYPNSYKAFHNLGRSYKELGEKDIAISYLIKAVNLDSVGWCGENSKKIFEALKEK